jgi:predicted nucleic acid-binding protein
MKTFFADSYALIDYVKGNPKYRKYFEEQKIVTTRLQLMELYYSTLLDSTEELAETYYDSFLDNCISYGDGLIKKAMKFRHQQRKRKLSYADALGYQLAQENEIKFLTGDKQFEKMGQVQYVK